ncbi:hypothetical protein VTL71DRAFT_10247 [Oculimacula yallundae]|uniref:Uncharacterized protein n=1 Tax=Oculimacula yallundae TaxID=86028 RepID=A0ABR4CU74_9HELO
MSPPGSPHQKRPWLNRQLSKIGEKLHKSSSEGKKNKAATDSAGVPTGNAPVVVGREVGFSAFGNGKEHEVGGDRGNKVVSGKENEAQVEVVEISTPHPGTPVKHNAEADADEKTGWLSEPAGTTAVSGTGSGYDGSHARTHGHVPYDGGDSGNAVGHGGIQGEVGAHTALNSHPVAGLFRSLD